MKGLSTREKDKRRIENRRWKENNNNSLWNTTRARRIMRPGEMRVDCGEPLGRDAPQQTLNARVFIYFSLKWKAPSKWRRCLTSQSLAISNWQAALVPKFECRGTDAILFQRLHPQRNKKRRTTNGVVQWGGIFFLRILKLFGAYLLL